MPVMKARDAAITSALKAYDVATAPARKALDAALASALKARDAATALAWARCYLNDSAVAAERALDGS